MELGTLQNSLMLFFFFIPLSFFTIRLSALHIILELLQWMVSKGRTREISGGQCFAVLSDSIAKFKMSVLVSNAVKYLSLFCFMSDTGIIVIYSVLF